MLIKYLDYLTHQKWMSRALDLAQVAYDADEIPVGAVIIDSSENLIAEGENRKERDKDPTAMRKFLRLGKHPTGYKLGV